jgi:hypothetical protein
MPINVADVCQVLSADRLGPYRARAGGDDLVAIQHYHHNILLSEALYALLQFLEVALRNRFEAYLVAAYGNAWYTETRFLAAIAGTQEQSQLADALNGLTKRGKPLTSGRVVAELNFGFWTGLLGNRYKGRFWGPAWRTLVGNQDLIDPARAGTDLPRITKRVNQILRDARHLRNRVFHHEPIWNDAELWRKYQETKRLLSWVSPDLAAWIEHTQLDRFRGVIQQLRGLQP